MFVTSSHLYIDFHSFRCKTQIESEEKRISFKKKTKVKITDRSIGPINSITKFLRINGSFWRKNSFFFQNSIVGSIEKLKFLSANSKSEQYLSERVLSIVESELF